MSPAYSRSPVLYGLCLSAWELVTASRQKIGILISMVTLTLSAGTVIGMAFDRDLNPIQRYDKQSCALQASFGLLGVGAGLQFLLLSFLSYQVIRTRKSKKRVDDYHVNVSANGLSGLFGKQVTAVNIQTCGWWGHPCECYSQFLSCYCLNPFDLLALSVGMTLYVTLLTSAADFWYYFWLGQRCLCVLEHFTLVCDRVLPSSRREVQRSQTPGCVLR
uniref:Uncharacterized protein LOC111124338 n=1 Tax=Crassostrea virginica TaxID=6565 RepID=A0A8B8D432_CRAVI|nr:uncharacterized protein LOC111124338 [Crassostrea virginica]